MWLERFQYVLVDHFRLAVHAAVLFAVGAFAAVPVIRYGIRPIRWLPMQVFRLVLRLMGRRPSLPRVAAVIWLFNSAVMFLYMASGFHPMLPKLFGIWTGLNVAVLAGAGWRGEPELKGLGRPVAGAWRPGPRLAIACGVMVIVLELPCFWYALAMGMQTGADVQSGAQYLNALQPRALAYLTVIVPALLVSAVAEAIAVRAGAPTRQKNRAR